MKGDLVFKKILFGAGSFLICFSLLFSSMFIPVSAEDSVSEKLYYYDDLVETVSKSDGTIQYPFFTVPKFDFVCIQPSSAYSFSVFYYLFKDGFSDSSSARAWAQDNSNNLKYCYGVFKSDDVFTLTGLQSSFKIDSFSYIDNSGNSRYCGFIYVCLNSPNLTLYNSVYVWQYSLSASNPLRFYLNEFNGSIPSGSLSVAKNPSFILPKSSSEVSIVGSSDDLLSVRYHSSGFSPSSGGNHFPTSSPDASAGSGSSGGSGGSGGSSSSSSSSGGAGGSASINVDADAIHFEQGSVNSSIAANAVHFEAGAVTGGSAVIDKDAVNVTVNNNNNINNDPEFQNSVNTTIDNINKGADGSGLHFNDILPHALEMVALVKGMPSLVSAVFGFLPSWCLNLVSLSFAVILTCVVATVIKGVFR